MLERETAVQYFDECLLTPVDLSHVLWVCTANTTEGIPTSLLSRFAVIEIGLPDADHFARIVETLKSDLADEIGLPDARLLPELDGENVDFLRETFGKSRDMRLLRRLLRRLIADGTRDAPEIIH